MLFIRLQLEMLENAIGEENSDVRAKLLELKDVTEKTIVEIRRVIAALSPSVLERFGLTPALKQLVHRFRQLYPVKVKLHLSPRLGRLPSQLEIITYRLVQECFNNIAKHSSATTVNIHLRSSDNTLELSVEDDGVGFDVESALNSRNSFGLSGMRERVALLGGEFRIRSLPRRGTVIQVELPRRA
jgi:signal transduction histidine kinase